MGKGRIYRDRQVRYTDSYSGREITCLTGYLGHSWQLYFTHPCWVDGATALVLKSERENHGNYFRYELASGELVQLTDFTERQLFEGCLSPATNRLYYWIGATLWEFRLDSLKERPVSEVPPPMCPTYGSQINVTADGRYVCALLMERGVAGEARSAELFELRPRSQLVRIDVAGGGIEVLHEDRRYITHVNTSPTRSDLLTFCHEGPWARVEQRIWGLNLDTREVWPIRPQHGEYSVIAEHWFADGERIGFRSHLRAANDTRFGHIRWDNRDHVEAVVPAYCRHFHSLDGSLVVGDGSPVYLLPAMLNSTVTWPYILLYRSDGAGWEAPRILAYHGSTFNGQRSHPHPRLTPDGRHVLYTSDVSGYANLYLAPVGDLDDLPVLDLETG